MRTIQHAVCSYAFRSEVRPEIESGYRCDAPVLEWADAHPRVWRIATTCRSRAFGIGSCEYIGWAQQSTAPDAVLERVRHLHQLLQEPTRFLLETSIFLWRARYTYRHFDDAGFTGGFVQLWEGRFPRDGLTLDYTPATLEVVVDRFVAWADRPGCDARVTVDGRTVRTLGG